MVNGVRGVCRNRDFFEWNLNKNQYSGNYLEITLAEAYNIVSNMIMLEIMGNYE